MPGSTGVQPFKRKQREEGKGRIETAEGQQRKSINRIRTPLKGGRRQGIRTKKQSNHLITQMLFRQPGKTGNLMGEANAHAEGAGRHRTMIGFRTEACEPGQNRRLPLKTHW